MSSRGVGQIFTPGVLTKGYSLVEKNSYEDGSRQARTIKRFPAESDPVLDNPKQ